MKKSPVEKKRSITVEKKSIVKGEDVYYLFKQLSKSEKQSLISKIFGMPKGSF